MGAAAKWTEPRRALRSRPRAALSRSPGAPLPGGPPQHIPRRRPRARRGPRAPPGAAGWPGTVAHKGQNRAYSERFLVHARVHAGLSPTSSPAMMSRPTKSIARSTTRMLLLALSVVLLGTARAAGTSVSSCPLNKVLIQNGNSIVVDVRALGHCHNHETVAHI